MKTTIMMMAVLSSEGWCSAISTARVDFPQETPGYMGTVIVTGNKDTSSPHKNLKSAKKGDEFTWIQVPRISPSDPSADIYFPVDGSQPTTPDAVKWSCANINNNPKSSITEWYMRMFGWTKPSEGTPWYMRMFGWTNSSEETPLKMGFSPLTPQESDKLHKEWENRIKNVFDPNTPLIDPDLHITQEPTPIITFDESMDKNNQQQFWEEIFRETASVSVGRILLYRLLLEIRRTQDGVGALDLGVPERKKFADVFRILFGANASTYDNSSNPSYSQLKNDLESEIFSLLQELGESSEKLQDFLSPSKKLQDSLSPSRDSGDSLSFVDTVNKLTSPIPALLDNAQKLESKISTAIEELEKKRLKDLEEKFDLQDNFNSKELQDLLSSSEDSDDSCSFGDTVNNLTSPIHALLDIVDDTKTKLIFPIDSLSDIVDDIRIKLIFPIDSLLNQVNNLALLGKSITSCSNIIMQDSKALQEKFKSLDEFLPKEESTQNWSSLLSFPLTFFPEIVEELQTKIQSIQNDAKSVREYEKSIKEHLQKKTLELQDMRSIQDNLKSIQSRVGFISECRVDPVSSTVKIIQQNVKAIQPGLKIQLSNFPSYYSLFKERSQARSICIINRANISNFFGFHIPTPNDFIWRYSHNTRKGSSCIGISFDPICKIATKVYQNDHGQLETGWETTPLSVYLCHEMLHWFHELRSPLRYLEEDANIVKSTSIETSTLSPLISLYFKPYIPSSQDWSNEIWSGDEFGYPQKKTEIKKAFPNLTQYGEKEGDTAIRGEEMRTVLGSHYSVTDYLEGDDLSENLFSCSLNYYFFQRDIKQQAAMRYGHSFRVIKAQHDSQIRLAHQVVLDSMNLITPEACQYWELKEGKALISKNWKNEFKKSMGDDDYNRLIRLDRWNRFLRIPPQFGSSALDQIESPTLDQTQNRSSRSRNFLMNLVELRDMFTIAILAYLYHQMFTELI